MEKENFKTALLTVTINMLSDLSKNDYIPFSKINKDNIIDTYTHIIYDDSNDCFMHEYNNACDHIHFYPIIMDGRIDEGHHDVIKTFSDVFSETSFYAIIDDKNKNNNSILIRSNNDSGEIKIQNEHVQIESF